MTKKQSTVSRREFLSNAAIIGASGTLGAGGLFTACTGGNSNGTKYTPLRPASEVYIPELPDKAMDGKPVRAGLIGCGGRGTGAAFNLLEAANGVSIVAVSDVFQEKVDGCRKRLKEEKNIDIPDDRCFMGFDAYKKVCELPDVDLVLIASPGLFHPDHLKYAIDKGKHAFCEKPAAVDPVGYRTFMSAVKQAQAKDLCIVTGTMLHYSRAYVESYKKIQEGYIGRITSGNVYCAGGHSHYIQRRPEWTDMDYMIRDHFSWAWLSGDILVDQLVHYIDVFTWFTHKKPVWVFGTGARIRKCTGNIYDSFSIDFEYEGGVHAHGIERQINNCDGISGVSIQGTKGKWNGIDGKPVNIVDLDGNIVWAYDDKAAKEQFKQHSGYTLEHVDLVNHIRSGKVINYAETTAISTMACIMALESAYTGKFITWDAMTQSDKNYMPDAFTTELINLEKYKDIPLPGTVYK